MLIFSIYNFDESEIEFSLIQKLKSSNFSEINASQEKFTHAIEKNNYKFYRLMACILSLSLKTPLSFEEHALLNYRKSLKRALDTGILHPSIKNEVIGLLNLTQLPIVKINPRRKKSLLFFTLRPSKSGFFSIIENIFNAYIISYMSGRNLVVSLEKGKWWPYKCDITELIQLDGLVFVDIPTKASSLMRFKKQDFFRDQQRSLTENSLANYNFIKIKLYKEFYQKSYKWLNQEIDIEGYSHSLYMRMGDKSQLEDFEWDESFILNKIGRLIKKGTVLILSDDIPRLKKNTISSANMTFDNDEYSGFWFGQESDSDAIEIIRKYLTMCLTEHLIGDTGSNLVNAAAWTRIALDKPPLDYNQFYNTPPFSLI